MNTRRIAVGVALVALGAASLQVEAKADDHGDCRIRMSEKSGQVELKIERASCKDDHDCGNTQMTEPLSAFTGITAADLSREGARLDAVLTAEAGTLRCSGAVHDAELAGAFTFEPDKAFVGRMREIGINGIDPEKLEVYALFRVTRDWVVSLQKAGVSGIDADNLIALRVQGVNPAEIKQVQAMGYHPTLDELIQMRIFHVTPDFIQRMKAKGFENLTIAKLVQIRIFKLAE